VGPARQRPLPGLIEEALGLQAVLQLFEPELELAQAGRRQEFNRELVRTLRLLHPDGTPGDEPIAIVGTHPGALQGRAKHHAAKLAEGIFERKVGVTRHRDGEVRDLALDPEVAEERILLDQPFDVSVDL